MKTAKELIKYVVFGLLLLLVCVFFVKSCTLSDRYSQKIGEYNALLEAQEKAEKVASENIEHALENIAGLIAKNKEITKQIKSTKSQLVTKNGKLLQLNKELAEAQDTGDKDTQISVLEETVNTWKEKFTLAESIIANKDEIIFNLTEKYEFQVVISDDYKKLYLDTKDLLGRNEVLFNITKRKLRTAKFGGTFKTIAIGVLGGFMTYQLIK